MQKDVIREIEQFLYHEARLLDERRFREWLDLFTDDVHYWMPVRSTRYPKTSRSIRILDRDRYEEDELAKIGELAILDEDKPSLAQRIARLETGTAWAEDPPSRTRRVIANVEVEGDGTALRHDVYSNFVVYRHRGESDQDIFFGRREDVLRRVDQAWRIARRKIVLDQNVLTSQNVSIFF